MADVFMFSGQGSQYYQMGRDLYDSDRVFRFWMDRLDGMAQALTGRSMVSVIYEPGRSKADAFDRLLFSNPAIFMVEYALAMTLADRGLRPAATLGSSLGIFAAAAVAGALDPENALEVVVELARVFEHGAPAGGMAAVLAAPEDCGPDVHEMVEIVSVSFDRHFVIAAPGAALAEATRRMTARGITVAPLPVRYPFHSRWIDPLKAEVTAVLGRAIPQTARIPVLCCARGGPLRDIDRQALWAAVRRPMLHRETIAGLEAGGPHRYVDAGPSGTLATLLGYMLAQAGGSVIRPVLTPFGRDLANLARLVGAEASG